MEWICRLGSCYLHQSRFPGHSLCYIDDIAFVVSPAVVMVAVALTAAVPADFSAQDIDVAR
jgi:hypothetical protein